jgi:hypothetical protein
MRVPAFIFSKKLNNPYSKASFASEIPGVEIEIFFSSSYIVYPFLEA